MNSSIKLTPLFSTGTIYTGNFMANVTVISHINKLHNSVLGTAPPLTPHYQTLFNLTPPQTNLWHSHHRKDNIYRLLTGTMGHPRHHV
jgi:hypothetical protein